MIFNTVIKMVKMLYHKKITVHYLFFFTRNKNYAIKVNQ